MTSSTRKLLQLPQRMRTAENDYRHARLHDPGHPDTERLRRRIADDKRWLVELTEPAGAGAVCR